MENNKRTAYHEAGHAVAALMVGRKFEYVTIEPEEDSLGHVLYEAYMEDFHPDWQDDEVIRPESEKIIITNLSGYAAEIIFCGEDSDPDGSASDLNTVMELAYYLCGSNEQIEAYVNGLLSKAKDILDNQSVVVERLTERLLQHKRLSYKEVRSIVRDARASTRP